MTHFCCCSLLTSSRSGLLCWRLAAPVLGRVCCVGVWLHQFEAVFVVLASGCTSSRPSLLCWRLAATVRGRFCCVGVWLQKFEAGFVGLVVSGGNTCGCSDHEAFLLADYRFPCNPSESRAVAAFVIFIAIPSLFCFVIVSYSSY